MSKIVLEKVAPGIFWLEVPKADLRMLCGCPGDAIKHLFAQGKIKNLEKDGIHYEQGPNAILLSDLSVQNGKFSNLSEFPFLHMLYRQGMILPNHPGNTGEKPLIIGSSSQLEGQLEYLHRGNYGLVDERELCQAGVKREDVDPMMAIKNWFAFGAIKPITDLCNPIAFDGDSDVTIKGVTIQRQSTNEFFVSYEGESVKVDLNLSANEKYLPAYLMPTHHFEWHNFAVLHCGEGDGWDHKRPCMASILIHDGDVYLIDAGPFVEENLEALGLSMNGVKGIFQTHAHDDHFAGITDLIQSGHRLKYYASPMVRETVNKKMTALMGDQAYPIDHFFDVVDLEIGEWIDIDGLQVRAVYSPHPVETTAFEFKAEEKGNERIYSHLADISSLALLDTIQETLADKKLDTKLITSARESYVRTVDVKKVDVGGGLIHGEPDDFKNDKSPVLVLSHFSGKFTKEKRKDAITVGFGTYHILKNDKYLNFPTKIADQYALKTWPLLKGVSDTEWIDEMHFIEAGESLELKDKGYLILSGVFEKDEQFAAEGAFLWSKKELGLKGTWKARNKAVVYSFDEDKLEQLLKDNGYWLELLSVQKIINTLSVGLLKNVWFLGPSLYKSLKLARHDTIKKGEHLDLADKPELVICSKGSLELYNSTGSIRVNAGEFCLEETVLLNSKESHFDVKAQVDSEVYRLPYTSVWYLPCLHWALMETFQKRCRKFGVSDKISILKIGA